MRGDKLNAGTGEVIGLSVVDLFAGTLLAVFVLFIVYMWIYQDPASECFRNFQNHVERVYGQRKEMFLDKPQFTILQARVVLREEWLSFEPCLWNINEQKQEQLRAFVSELVTVEFQSCIKSFRIEGHADSTNFSVRSCIAAYPRQAAEIRRIGYWEDNTQLSQNRARSIFEVLRQMDFVDRMWQKHRVHIGGYGDSWPLVEDDPESPRNRRVELHFEFYEAEPSRG